MQTDFRDHSLFKNAEALTKAWLRPGSGKPSTLGPIVASSDGRRAVAAASVCEALEGAPSTRIALVDLDSGDLEILTKGPRSDSSPKWSPDGRSIAFLSDRDQAHINRLYILDPDSGTDRATPAVPGFVEYLHWSGDGTAILIGVAGYGSDLAGAHGAISVSLETEAAERPPWAPAVDGVPDAAPWRSLWIYDFAADTVRQVTPQGTNVWEAAWCGQGHIVAICSDRPDETWWYTADVRLIPIAGGEPRTLFRPEDQLGWLTASPSGKTVGVVEAVCSDRNFVAGDLRLIDLEGGAITRPVTLDADVVQVHWRDDAQLQFMAAQGPDTIIGLFDLSTQTSREIWRGRERTTSGLIFSEFAPLGNPADALIMIESYFDAPTLVALENGREREIRRFGSEHVDAAVRPLGSARDISWTAPDGLTIHGWLVTPPGNGPHPLIMLVHGGPVWYIRPSYLGRSALAQMALAAGYALFYPNVRGSSGRGQAFARHVFGDMGGTDLHDYLSGLDALVAAGIADPKRIGVIGVSYGGFMTSWLITQDQRFAAAVPVAPVTNWVSERLTCNVPTFCDLFLDDRMDNPTGKFVTRSPVYFADRVTTPTLNICGALDRITPPGQALEFHRALQLAGVESVLLTYPLEGHGVRGMPAMFDYTARVLSWFVKHMPAAPR